MLDTLENLNVQPGDVVEYGSGGVYTVHPNKHLSSPKYNMNIPFYYEFWCSGLFRIVYRNEQLNIEDFV